MHKIILTILLLIVTFPAFAQETQTNLQENKTKFDFDGDGKADVAVFRPSDGYWYIWKSSGGYSFVKWGTRGDRPVPDDYDGDGRADVAVFRGVLLTNNGNIPNTWYIRRSSDDSVFIKQWGTYVGTPFGGAVQADYDGDGRTDLAVYHGTDIYGEPNHFVISQSSTGSIIQKQWGLDIDWRVPADYDGDGKADIAVYRDNTINGAPGGVWYILQSSDNKMRVEYFGLETDRPYPADYDGDGKTDIAVWRASNATWYRINSSDRSFIATKFGLSEDKPVPADYDGDGKTDIAVFRPSTGIWYLLRSRDGFSALQFGLSDDVPIPNIYYYR